MEEKDGKQKESNYSLKQIFNLEEQSLDLQQSIIEAQKRLESLRNEQKRISKKGKFKLIAVMVVSSVIMFFSWNYFDEKVSKLETLYQNAKTKKEEALKQVSKLETLYQDDKKGKEEILEKLSDIKEYVGSVMVKVNSVYNADEENSKISDDLEASKMRFLWFDFNSYFLDDNVKKATIYIDIYKPDGSLESSINSPIGHTTSFVANGSGQCIGWGNSKRSIYSSGTYCVHFVYKDAIIHSQRVVISH